jgi:hypothetical protein
VSPDEGKQVRRKPLALKLSPRLPFEIRSRLLYWERRSEWPTRSPVTLNQKVQWKMRHDRRPLLTTFTDKIAVRELVTQAMGPEVLTRLYAVSDDPAELDPSMLPSEFVIKPSHLSGRIWIVADPVRLGYEQSSLHRKGRFTANDSSLDWDHVVAVCRGWLVQDYSDIKLEWAYRNVPPRIMIEELLLDDDHRIPKDYKFLVFHGNVRHIEVSSDRFVNLRWDTFSPRWEPFEAPEHRSPNQELLRPESLDQMISLAEALGQETDFVRVDLYEVGGRVVFGEMTNYPSGGIDDYYSEESDLELGQHWNIVEHLRPSRTDRQLRGEGPTPGLQPLTTDVFGK